MREIERIERIVELVKEIWLLNPDLRYTQLIHHLQWRYSKQNDDRGRVKLYEKNETSYGTLYTDIYTLDLFSVEDSDFEKFLEAYLKHDQEILGGE